MKAATIYNRYAQTAYPNGITRKELLQKAIDLLLTAAIGAGAAATFLFLLIL